MVRGSILRGVITIAAVAVVGYVSLSDADPALAYHPYHYARQWTSQAGGLYTHGDIPCCLPAEYFGWIGINGQITTPSHVPRLNDYWADHAAGFVDVNFSTSPLTWVQTGWFVGIIGGGGQLIQSGDFIYKYVEVQTSNSYYVNLVGGPLTLGEAVIYRVDRDATAGCWNVYVYYNSKVGRFCNLGNNGAPQATSEVYQGTAAPPVEMALSKWGWSNPNTNNALRLKGGCTGYEPWDTALCARYTARYDEDPSYTISHFNQWFYFQAQGGN